MNKKGIQLSVTFLVTTILAIVSLGLGFTLLFNINQQGQSLVESSQEDLESHISRLACASDETFCINKERQTIKRGESAVFGVKVLNQLESTQKFKFELKRVTYYPDGNTKEDITDKESPQGTDRNELNFIRPFEIEIESIQHGQGIFVIVADKQNLPGRYTFDINVDTVMLDLGFPSVTRRVTVVVT